MASRKAEKAPTKATGKGKKGATAKAQAKAVSEDEDDTPLAQAADVEDSEVGK